MSNAYLAAAAADRHACDACAGPARSQCSAIVASRSAAARPSASSRAALACRRCRRSAGLAASSASRTSAWPKRSAPCVGVGDHQAGGQRRLQPVQHRVEGKVEKPSKEGGVDPPAERRRRVQHSAGAVRQGGRPGHDDVADRGRHGASAAVATGQPQQLDQEERVPAGPLPQRVRRVGVQRGVQRPGQRGHLGRGDPGQLDPVRRAGPARNPNRRAGRSARDGCAGFRRRQGRAVDRLDQCCSSRSLDASAQCRSSSTTSNGRRLDAAASPAAIWSNSWNRSAVDDFRGSSTSAASRQPGSGSASDNALSTASHGHSGGAPSSDEHRPTARRSRPRWPGRRARPTSRVLPIPGSPISMQYCGPPPAVARAGSGRVPPVPIGVRPAWSRRVGRRPDETGPSGDGGRSPGRRPGSRRPGTAAIVPGTRPHTPVSVSAADPGAGWRAPAVAARGPASTPSSFARCRVRSASR